MKNLSPAVAFPRSHSAGFSTLHNSWLSVSPPCGGMACGHEISKRVSPGDIMTFDTLTQLARSDARRFESKGFAWFRAAIASEDCHSRCCCAARRRCESLPFPVDANPGSHRCICETAAAADAWSLLFC